MWQVSMFFRMGGPCPHRRGSGGVTSGRAVGGLNIPYNP